MTIEKKIDAIDKIRAASHHHANAISAVLGGNYETAMQELDAAARQTDAANQFIDNEREDTI